VFKRKADAERHLTSVEHSKLTGAYADPVLGRTTVADYWAMWSERQQWRATTRASTSSLFERHVLPSFGGRPLSSLRRGDLEAWATRLPLSRRTARQALQYVSTMLDAAEADGFVPTNVARGAKRPRVDADPAVPFTDEEVGALRDSAPAWFEVALTLGLGAGLRQAEATGLTVDRIDFLRRQLTVDRQLTTLGPDMFGPLKTNRSYRTVPLADAVVEGLARHVEVHGTGREGLVLHLPDGGPVFQTRFGRIWRELRDGAGLPAARFHDTRHTFASTLLSGGVSVAAAADYLGHSPAVLLGVYAHLMPGDHERARSVVQTAFERNPLCHIRVTPDAGRG
jgi:integrase